MARDTDAIYLETQHEIMHRLTYLPRVLTGSLVPTVIPAIPFYGRSAIRASAKYKAKTEEQKIKK